LSQIGYVGDGSGNGGGLSLLLVGGDVLRDLLGLLDLGGDVLRLLDLRGDLSLLHLSSGVCGNLLGLLHGYLLGLSLLDGYLLDLRRHLLRLLNGGDLLRLLSSGLLHLSRHLMSLNVLGRHGSRYVLGRDQSIHALRRRD